MDYDPFGRKIRSGTKPSEVLVPHFNYHIGSLFFNLGKNRLFWTRPLFLKTPDHSYFLQLLGIFNSFSPHNGIGITGRITIRGLIFFSTKRICTGGVFPVGTRLQCHMTVAISKQRIDLQRHLLHWLLACCFPYFWWYSFSNDSDFIHGDHTGPTMDLDLTASLIPSASSSARLHVLAHHYDSWLWFWGMELEHLYFTLLLLPR